MALVIGLYEKYQNKPIDWRLVFGSFIFCVFVATFQAWIDEHHNTELLVLEKAVLSSEKSELSYELRDKQREVDYLRDHRLDGMPPQPASVVSQGPSNAILRAMQLNTEMLKKVVERSAEEKVSPLKTRTLSLSQQILSFAQERSSQEPSITAGGTKEAVDREWDRASKFRRDTESTYNLRFAGPVQALLEDLKSAGIVISVDLNYECGFGLRISECGIALSKIGNRM